MHFPPFSPFVPHSRAKNRRENRAFLAYIHHSCCSKTGCSAPHPALLRRSSRPSSRERVPSLFASPAAPRAAVRPPSSPTLAVISTCGTAHKRTTRQTALGARGTAPPHITHTVPAKTAVVLFLAMLLHVVEEAIRPFSTLSGTLQWFDTAELPTLPSWCFSCDSPVFLGIAFPFARPDSPYFDLIGGRFVVRPMHAHLLEGEEAGIVRQSAHELFDHAPLSLSRAAIAFSMCSSTTIVAPRGHARTRSGRVAHALRLNRGTTPQR